MVMHILAVNPGSTSTKIAIYEDEKEIFKKNIEHNDEIISKFDNIIDQYDMRKAAIMEALESINYKINNLSCVVGRGGMLPPVKAGGYIVNDKMKQCIISGKAMPHASNLGALVADAIACQAGVKAYIYDAVSADEFAEIAKITGMPNVVRRSFCHVLNSKAMARKYCLSKGKDYKDFKGVVAHLGGGISISAHKNGAIIDSIADDAGQFSPERAGSVPLTHVVDMCYSGDFTKQQMMHKIRGLGGMKAYLGTADLREIEKMIDSGNELAKKIFEAQAYQIAKGIGQLVPTLKGEIDTIILTGGVANSKRLIALVIEYISSLAPEISVMPGENELESLAYGALRIMKGEEQAHIFELDD